MDKKSLIAVSLCAVVLLIIGSLSNVVGFQSVKSTVNYSPLFTTRTQRAINKEQNGIKPKYLGIGKEYLWQFPNKDNKSESLRKTMKVISNMDKKTFERFTEFSIQKIILDNTLYEINPDIIVKTLYLMRTQTDAIFNSFLSRRNQDITSSNYYSICHWFPGCTPIFIAGIIFIFIIEIIVIIVDIFFPTMGTFSSHTGDMRRAIR